jgi:hypothetical protein
MPGFSYSAAKFTDLWRTTAPFYQKRALDMLKIESPLYNKLLGSGRFQGRTAGEGTRVVVPILAHKGSGHKFYNFDDVLPATTAKVFEQMQFDWKLSASGYTFNEIVVGMNRQSKIVDMMKGLRKAFERDIADFYRMQLYSIGSSTKEWGGLGYLIAENPYLAGTKCLQIPRGGTPGDNWQFWRNKCGQIVNADVSDLGDGDADLMNFGALSTADKDVWSDKVMEILGKVYDCMERRGQEIDTIVCNLGWLRPIRYFLQKKLHVNNVSGEKRDGGGFQDMEYNGQKIMLDKWCPANKIYFLNIDSFTSWYLKEFRFVEWTTKGLHNSFNREVHMAMISSFTCDMPKENCVVTYYKTTGDIPGGVGQVPDSRNVCKDNYDFSADGFLTKEGDGTLANNGEVIEHDGYSAAGVYVDPLYVPADLLNQTDDGTQFFSSPKPLSSGRVPFDVGDGVEELKVGDKATTKDGTEIERLT